MTQAYRLVPRVFTPTHDSTVRVPYATHYDLLSHASLYGYEYPDCAHQYGTVYVGEQYLYSYVPDTVSLYVSDLPNV